MINKVLTLLFLTPLFSIAQDLSWSSYYSISSGSDGYGRPRICVTDNTPFIIWTKDSSPRNIKASKWNGSSFSSPYSILSDGLDPAGGWQAPEMASISDTIYVVFVSTAIANNAIFLVRSFDGGDSFSDTVRVSDDSNLNRYNLPNVTIDDFGHPIVAYMEYDLNWHNPRQMVKRSINYGSNFGLAVNGSVLSPGEPCDCCRADIVSSGDDIYLLYRNNDLNIRDSYISHSNDGGSTFSSFVDIDLVSWNFPNCPSSTPRAIISGDSLVVARRSGGSNNINEMYISAVNRFDLQFEYNNIVDPVGFGIQDYPELAGNEDTIGLVWQDNRDGSIDCYFNYSVLGSSNLDGSMKISNPLSSGNQTDPDVAYFDKTFYFTYIDNSSYEVMFVSASLKTIASTIISAESKRKDLIETINIMGQIVSDPGVNIPLFYLYSDGTVEKKIIIE